MEIAEQLAKELAVKIEYSHNIIALIDEGNTIPFIARYRKERTGSCDDQVLRQFGERLTYLRNLEDRKKLVLQSIEEQGKLTDEISIALERATTLVEVEDIYRPFKQKRRTRATIARERGLEPLADLMIAQTIKKGSLEEIAAPYINPEKSVLTWEDAAAGAQDIIAERISDDASARQKLRAVIRRNGALESKASKEEDSVYKTYYDFSQSLMQVPGHRILAMNRGEKEGFLKVNVSVQTDAALSLLRELYVKPGSITSDAVLATVQDAWSRLLWPSLEREIRNDLTEKAEVGAIQT
ncbi:MAG: Tex-like N-terminal domain-containing protein, partial [Eubacteriales bacterium]